MKMFCLFIYCISKLNMTRNNTSQLLLFISKIFFQYPLTLLFMFILRACCVRIILFDETK